MSDLLSKLQSWGLLLLIFLLPLFFLPITTDFFDFQKLALLVVGTLLLALVWALRGVVIGRLSFTTTIFDLPVVALALSSVLAAFVRTPNKMDAFLIPGTATLILSCTLLYFLITQTVRTDRARLLVYVLFGSGIIVALVSAAASMGLLESVTILPAFMKQKVFSLVGAPLPTMTFVGVLVVLALGGIIRTVRAQQFLLSGLFVVLSVVFALSLGAVLLQAAPGKPAAPKLLPLTTGWAIATEALKHSPFGVGPGNFIAGFMQYRPVEFNQTDVWNLRFAVSSNWYLQLFTEAGIVGLLVFVFLVWRIVRLKTMDSSIRYTLYAILLLFLLIPANLLLLIIFYLLLALAGVVTARTPVPYANPVNAEYGVPNTALPALVLVVVVGVAITVGIFGSRAYAAEMTYKRALSAAARNDGIALYNLMIEAIKRNPRVDRYRITYSQTNLALANTIAQKQDITDQDRQTITALVQQAIREGQGAVALNRESAINWENLANIYRSLIPFAQGADQWASTAYSQAIAFDPVNPLLRVALGGVHYGAGRFDEAIRSFELATIAKPDFANAHYNLAAALREKGDQSSLERAVKEMEQVLSLVQPGTQDYQTAQRELENLKSKLPKTSTAGGETLQAPQPSPAPVIKPPLELPEEAGPPEGPTPSP